MVLAQHADRDQKCDAHTRLGKGEHLGWTPYLSDYETKTQHLSGAHIVNA
jgi:hypothetical protein